MHQTGSGAHLHAHVMRMLGMFRTSWEDLTDEKLNAEPGFTPANTILQLAVHVAGSTRFWTISNTGGVDFHRDRDAEFLAVGTGAQIRADYDLLVDQISAHLPNLSANDLAGTPTFPASGMSAFSGPLSAGDGVIHAIEHIGIHLGHVQIQRQMLGLAPIS
ncbi:MAG TPA: DinB family protein [Thermomicrobiales bacterium]|nr:DinB family protein [Thermomicrobiales bacterium]